MNPINLSSRLLAPLTISVLFINCLISANFKINWTFYWHQQTSFAADSFSSHTSLGIVGTGQLLKGQIFQGYQPPGLADAFQFGCGGKCVGRSSLTN